MIKLADSILDKVKGFLNENPSLTKGLIGGGLGAAGGILAGNLLTHDDPNEKPSETAKRKLKNALVLGTLGAGAGGLLAAGLNTMMNVDERPMPVTSIIFNRPVGVAAAGTAGALGGKALNTWRHGDSWMVAAKKLTGETPKSPSQAVELIRNTINGTTGTLPTTANSSAWNRILNAFRGGASSTTSNEIQELAKAFGVSANNKAALLDKVLDKLNTAGIKVESNSANLRKLTEMSGTFASKLKRNKHLAIPAAVAAGLAGYGMYS